MKFVGFALLPLLFCSRPAVPQTEARHHTHITWDQTSLRLVSRGNYGRITRLQSGDLMAVYEHNGVCTRQSRDEGQSWGKEVEVARSPLGGLANPEVLQTRGGDILVFSNLRPSKDQNPAPNFAICLSRSLDGGRTFSPLQTVFKAGTDGQVGCWEPAALQLPSGEIELFFADESPFPNSSEQQITLLRSSDNGWHWSAPKAASFRAGHRDGMPVPTQLQNGDIAFAIEDNGLSGTFKPSIVHTSKTDLWKSGPVAADSPNRWGALQTPLDAAVYAGAPYLRILKNGETALSFQQADDGEMRHSHMTVCLGDASARNFGMLTQPFAGFKTSSQLWNGLFVKDKETLTAITSTKIGDIFGVWTIDGYLVRD